MMGSSHLGHDLSRRELLQRAGGAAALSALGPGVLAACGGSSSPAAEVDVAIIGGGPSGLYAAYRLLTGTQGKGRKPTVSVFEASGRLGGRIWSVVPPGAPHLIAEFGGMRFLKTQEIVPRLVKALNLPFVPFSAGNDRNLYYLRAHRFMASQLTNPAVVPYSLPAGERGKTPAELLLKGIEAYVPGAATLSGAQWEQVKKTKMHDGQLLADQGFWNLLQTALGPEGFNLVADGVGYPSLVENWNAVEEMQLMSGDFHPGAAYFTITGGYQRLPLTLGTLAQRAGAAIHLNNTVRSVAPLPGGRVKLTVQSATGATTTVSAGHVIMAIPLDPMTALVERSPFLQQRQFADALATAGTATASKSFFTFTEPWWNRLGIVGGYSITDLPVKRCWYFGTEGRQPGANPANRTSLLMLYNDLTPAEYWGGYQPASAFNGPPAPRTSPPELVATTVQQLSELHGIDVPKPEWSGFIEWHNEPYGDAFNFWQIHAHSWEVIPYLRQPFDGVKLSICGDCWSPAQNWIESGLTSTEGMLQSVFGYRPPPWLPEGTGIST
jgi:monoamine oxidase